MAKPLRKRAERAVESLGRGLLTHPANGALRRALAESSASEASAPSVAEAFARDVRILLYRMLVLLLARERGVFRSSVSGSPAAVVDDVFNGVRAAGGASGDLWARLGRFVTLLGEPAARQAAGVPDLGEWLWSDAATPFLPSVAAAGPDERGLTPALADGDLLAALRCLAGDERSHPDERLTGFVLGIEAVASVHAHLLGTTAEIDAQAGRFEVSPTVRGERRTRGAFYTPPDLVEHLLATTLDPLMKEAIGAEPEAHIASGAAWRERSATQRLLALRVCDPACGGGAFLVPAAERIAARLERLDDDAGRSRDAAPRRAVAEVVQRCVFGVDLDPVGVELCRLALWFACDDPSLPREAIDRHVRVGDALLGAPAEVCGSEAADGDARVRADAWCVRFLGRREGASVADRVVETPGSTSDADRRAVCAAARGSGAFHWALEFPEVFHADGRDACNAGFDAVIGNPPFLNQLERTTAAARGVAALLRAASDGVIRRYADSAAAFLERATRLCRAGGRVSLVQPHSILVTSDAKPLRDALAERCALKSVWVAGEAVFDGTNVLTCALTLEVGGEPGGVIERFRGGAFERLADVAFDRRALIDLPTWGPLVAAAFGVPEFIYDAAGVIADIADSTADFRDQYYGLTGFIVEDEELADGANGAEAASEAEHDARYPPLVTAGVIDLARCDWGDAPLRALKREWRAPRVDRASLAASGELGAWMDRRLRPKVLVATQTPVLEPFVDERGRLLPGVPLISVTAKGTLDQGGADAAGLWLIAAVIGSPVASAIACQRYAGAAMSANAIKVSARQVAALPTPADRQAWSDAARCFADAQREPSAARAQLLQRYARTIVAAYRVPSDESAELLAWWNARLSRSERRHAKRRTSVPSSDNAAEPLADASG